MSWFRTTWPLCPSLNYPAPVSHRVVKPRFVPLRPFCALRSPVRRFQQNLVIVEEFGEEREALIFVYTLLFCSKFEQGLIRLTKSWEKLRGSSFFSKKKRCLIIIVVLQRAIERLIERVFVS